METIPLIALAGILAVAVVNDLRSQRIPNRLTCPAMLAGLAWHAATGGLDGALFSLAGLGLGLGLMLVPYAVGVMGAGDAKLMAACGAWLGAAGVFQAFLLTSLAGGLYALAVLSFHLPQLGRVMGGFWESVQIFIATRRFTYARREAGLPRLCYGVAIAAGTAVSMALDAAGLGLATL